MLAAGVVRTVLCALNGFDRMPAKAWRMSLGDIRAFGNLAASERNRYSISSGTGKTLPGSEASGTLRGADQNLLIPGHDEKAARRLLGYTRRYSARPEKRDHNMRSAHALTIGR